MDVVLLQNFPLRSHKALSVYLSNIVQELAKIPEINLTVISSGDQQQSNDINFKHISTKGDPYSFMGNLTFSFRASKILRKLKKNQNIDIIHGLNPLSSLAAIKLSNIAKDCKTIYDLRSPWLLIGKAIGTVPLAFSSLYIRFAAFVEKMMMKRIDGFILITKALYNYYKQQLPKNHKHLIIPSGVNLNIFNTKKIKIEVKRKLNLNEDDIILGYIGSLEKARELWQIIDYFTTALESFPELRFVLVGGGDSSEMMLDKAKELGIEDKIFFVPPVPFEEVPYWIQEFDICLSHIPDKTAYQPSSPNKILEYAALNKTILATDIAPHQSFLEEYGKGKLYCDEESFNYALKEVIQETKVSRADFNLNDYCYRRLANRIFEFYKKII